ncbi:CdaR family protein [Filibacter tadaridae]|uniref:YbbR-like protein n=1 Tax=Filibacter tadaridae TaxID=2483811 RepID=A0A3P5WN64_9BACL|nr:CdaR family protein [Filibacter tadaridae]VDC22402.1 YbbR-like protein [Filibacter tadaridae]
MDKMMGNPWFLRFTALFLAIVLFVFVRAGEENANGKPVGDSADIIRDIKVEVYYDNENLVVTGIPETVNMAIEGPANLVQTTKLIKDFTLFVDLRSLPMGTHTVPIEHENISGKLNARLDPATIKVVIEEKITKSFKVDPEMNERMLAEDFDVVKMEVDPSTIEVTGPKSVIESISFVKASVTGDDGLKESFEQKARVRVLDKDLNKLNVTIVPEQVNVKVDIVEYNKEIPIVLKAKGKPPAGVTLDSIETDEKTIWLSGSRKVLESLDEFVVDVDISKVEKQETFDIELKKPDGISKMSTNKIKVKVDVTVVEEELEATNPETPVEPEKLATKEFTEFAVTVNGLDEQFNSSFHKPADGLIVLTVTAEQDVIDTLDKKDFTVYVDASHVKEEGEKTFPIQVEGPTDVRWKLSEEEVSLSIKLA